MTARAALWQGEVGMRQGCSIVLLAGLLILPLSPAGAATRYVRTDGAHTFPFTTWEGAATEIQAALDAAESGDRILVAAGRYAGEGNRSLAFHGKALELESLDGPLATMIDCGWMGWGVAFDRGEPEGTLLRGFTICNAFNAVLCTTGATVRIEDCVLTSNGVPPDAITTEYEEDLDVFGDPLMQRTTVRVNSDVEGGAILCSGGRLSLTGVVLADNSAGLRGGAMLCTANADVSVRDSWFSGNFAGLKGTQVTEIVTGYGFVLETFARSWHGGGGGGVYADGGSILFSNCVWETNRAAGGGGAVSLTSGAVLRVEGCTFSGNEALQTGRNGVLTITARDPVTGDVVYEASEVLEPESAWGGDGGAIEVRDATGHVAGCLLAGNRAAGIGGAVFGAGGTIEISDTALRGNSAGADPGGETVITIMAYDPVSGAVVYSNRQTVATELGAARGGAIGEVSGVTTISGCEISGNRAAGGGALYSAGSMSVDHSVLRGNSADLGAGALVEDGSLRMEGSVAADNTALHGRSTETITISAFRDDNTLIYESAEIRESAWGIGGAIAARRADVIVTSSWITNNAAGEAGGAFHLTEDSFAKLVNSVVASNGAGYRYHSVRTIINWDDGGSTNFEESLEWDSPSSAASCESSALRVIGCTVAGNGQGGYPDAVALSSGAWFSAYGSIVWPERVVKEADCGMMLNNCVVSEAGGGFGNRVADPRLVDGWRLTAQSPCIDAVVPLLVSPTDIEGEARWDFPARANGLGIADIGADEFVDRNGDGIADATGRAPPVLAGGPFGATLPPEPAFDVRAKRAASPEIEVSFAEGGTPGVSWFGDAGWRYDLMRSSDLENWEHAGWADGAGARLGMALESPGRERLAFFRLQARPR